MPFTVLAPVPHLSDSARIGPLGRSRDASGIEVAALIGLGIGAALLTTLVDFSLRIPGHHIVYAIFPLALGFALVPRRLAGVIMSGSAMASVLTMGAAGLHTPGVGVLTGLALVGPLLDRALRWGGTGLRLYGSFVLAGVFANGGAFLVRGVVKYAGIGALGGSRPLADWLSVAVWSYLLSGLLAGVVSAAAWFQLRRGHEPG
jgi:hypothetical protein